MAPAPGPQRALTALVQVLGLATWFSASAVVPSLRAEWGIDLTAAVWLTAATQLGFVVGALASAALALADRVPAHLLLAAGATGAATCTLAFALLADGLATAVPLRFATGLFLAGVYPVGMKLMASWSAPDRRARAMGLLIAALTLGSALPHLIGVLAWPWRPLMSAAACATLVAALLSAALLRPGPHLARSAPARDPAYALTLFRERAPGLVNLGYLGHMWELYALWTWLPLFGADAVRDLDPRTAGLAAFTAIGVAGVAGCLLGGWAADRFGRPRTAATALAVSGACCLLSPLAHAAPPPVLLAFAAVWGAAVIADSGVFSTMLSEVVDGPRAGTALTAQTAAGFLLTVVAIQLVPLVAEAVTWRYALVVLALGPVVGVLALTRPRAA
ncbi:MULTISPECIES: MFS transporter [Actinosynnema]|uniref:MFS transporter n=1 Tax=Actinosynnema TaxID=40566 RepID=UPI0020A28746|nr:MFS transporter [Actinosynnema pretiosum]MCP2096305.1 Sugar phosphate permease [Actinosynnema pretiosum]